MKYLKTYENNSNQVWVVIYTSWEDAMSNFVKVFKDYESADNYFFTYLNERKENSIHFNEKRDMRDDEYILTDEDADEFIQEEYSFDLVIESKEIEIYELPEKIKMLKDTKKYNL